MYESVHSNDHDELAEAIIVILVIALELPHDQLAGAETLK
jgi:hypothetical protein